MKTIFLKDDRLREILVDRNKEVERLLLNGTLKGTCYTKLSTREEEGRTHFGWEITDLESGQKIEETVQEGKIEPTGSITPLKDYFKPMENIGVFKKGSD